MKGWGWETLSKSLAPILTKSSEWRPKFSNSFPIRNLERLSILFLFRRAFRCMRCKAQWLQLSSIRLGMKESMNFSNSTILRLNKPCYSVFNSKKNPFETSLRHSPPPKQLPLLNIEPYTGRQRPKQATEMLTWRFSICLRNMAWWGQVMVSSKRKVTRCSGSNLSLRALMSFTRLLWMVIKGKETTPSSKEWNRTMNTAALSNNSKREKLT